MTSLAQTLLYVLGIARILIFIHFIMSWLISFNVLNIRQPVVSQFWDILSRILEPIYRPIRRFIPHINGIDLSPLVALIAIYLLERIIANNLF